MNGSRGPLPGTSNAGRPRKSRLSSTPGPKPAPKAPSTDLVALPTPTRAQVAPKGLGRSGKAVWKQVAGAVWLSPADHRTLESLARTLDQCDELQKLLDRDGLILSKPITDRTGQIVGSEAYAHPALAALRSAERRTEALRRELALSPGARIRLGLDVLAAQAAEKAATERIRAGARKLAGA